MTNTIRDYLQSLKTNRVKRRRAGAVLLALSLIVATGVTWQLHLTGITLTGDAYCGYEEHQHSESCYEKQLVCGLEESEGHTHTDACYEEQQTLSCTHEEHTHSEEAGCYETQQVLVCQTAEHTHSEEAGCYDSEGNLICQIPEHTHTDACYETQQTLVCTKEEHTHTQDCYTTERVLVCTTPEGEGHTHTDECYEEVLVCEKPEHVHTLECYSNSSADTETSADWEATLPTDLTDDWADNAVAVAKSQLGYQESADNYKVGDDGQTRNGYTRYGAWYGNEYGDWDAMFASFCIHYAGIDQDVFPYAAGAQSWISQLKDKDLYSTEAAPEAGDLVFFDDTMGIVTDVKDSSLTVVAGDVDGAVQERGISLSDVTGVGLLPENPDQETEEPEEPTETPAEAPTEQITGDAAETEEVTEEKTEPDAGETETTDEETPDYAARVEALLAASDEEFVTLWQEYESAEDAEAFEAYIASLETENAETYLALIARVEALVNSQVDTLEETDDTTSKDLGEYLKSTFIPAGQTETVQRGTITLNLLNADDTVVTKNASGNYEVEVGKDYKVQFAVEAPYGIETGTYTYQLPSGITYTPTSGEIFNTTTKEKIADWSMDANGKVTFTFNEKAENALDVKFNFTASVAFAKTEEPIPFDGGIKIEVKQPPDENPKQKYSVSKYKNGDITNNTINWQASVVGDGEHQIVGTTVTDILSGTNQTMEKQNITLVIWENEYYSDGSNRKYRHEFTISENDPNLKWTEDADGNIIGWTYTVPETLTGCKQGHDEGYQHTDDAKTYTVKDTDTIYFRYSTKIVAGSDGPYTNSFTHGEETASYTTDTPRLGVVKTGGFDADAGVYKWHLELSVPKVSSGALLNASLRDRMDVLDTNGKAVAWLNIGFDSLPDNAVTATVTKADGSTETVTVPKYTGSESSDVQYVYKSSIWKNNATGQVYYYLDFYKRCDCTADHCAKWENGKCNSGKLGAFCRCFNGDAVTFKVDVEQDAEEVLKEYQGLGYKIDNYAWAQRSVVQPSGSTTTVTDDQAEVKEDIPGVFKKENIAKPSAGNGWIAGFEITLNESFADLSTMEEGVTITDTMSNTLVFLPDSLTITAADEKGGKQTLTKDSDYTVSYDSEKHVVTIHIPKPGAYQYTLEYGASINVPSGEDQTYSNSATVTILGHTYEDYVSQTGITNWAGSSASYSVSLHKMAADKTVEGSTNQKAPLAGAKFGLFTSSGIKMTEATTDADGNITFNTQASTGLSIYPDTAYYIQELQAPDGYNTDETKYWFFFDGEGTDPTVEGAALTKLEGRETPTGVDAPFQFTNTTGYVLPSTGGSGTAPYVLIGLSLMAAATVVYGYERRRHGRRGER